MKIESRNSYKKYHRKWKTSVFEHQAVLLVHYYESVTKYYSGKPLEIKILDTIPRIALSSFKH